MESLIGKKIKVNEKGKFEWENLLRIMRVEKQDFLYTGIIRKEYLHYYEIEPDTTINYNLSLPCNWITLHETQFEIYIPIPTIPPGFKNGRFHY